MKKALAVILAAAMTLSMTACGNSGNGGGTETPAVSASGEATAWVPEHDITVRVPKAAGDTMDTITRLVTKSFTEKYGTDRKSVV